MQKRKRILALAGAIMLSIALPIAVAQDYFKYSPYPVPVLCLLAVILYLWYFITSITCRKLVNFLYARKPMLSFFVFIIIGAIIGSVLGAGEWIAIKKSQDHISLLKDKSETKPSPVTDSSSRQTETTVIVKTKEQEQPTAEEIAEALKKKIEPHIKSNEAIKYPPDITKARQILITSTNQFEPNFREKLKDVSTIVPGYFEFSADPSPNSVYSYPSVNTKDNFSTHFYASIRLAAMENVQTMDFMGRDIWVVVAPGWNGYLIYETEQLQTSWRPIRVKTDPVLNTLGIYQKGRNVSIFINNQYVDSYTKAIPPRPGPFTIAVKANKNKGGKMFFRDFSVWDFEIKK